MVKWYACFEGHVFLDIGELEEREAALRNIGLFNYIGPFNSFTSAKAGARRHYREMRQEIIASQSKLKNFTKEMAWKRR